MKEMWRYAKAYKDDMNLMDFAFFKLCLVSMGVLLGITVPNKHKKKIAAGATIIFAFTYAPLMTKFLGVVIEDSKKYE